MGKYLATLAVISTCMVTAFVWAVLNGGSPAYVKGVKIDAATMQKLRDYKYATDTYAASNRALPEKLQKLSYESPNREGIEAAKITYKITSPTTYELCSVFTGEDTAGGYDGQEFAHKAGKDCLSFTVTFPTPYQSPTPWNQPVTPQPPTTQTPPQPAFTLVWSDTPATRCEYFLFTTVSPQDPNAYLSTCTVATNGKSDTSNAGYCQIDKEEGGHVLQQEKTKGVFVTTAITATKPQVIKAYARSSNGSKLTCTQISELL